MNKQIRLFILLLALQVIYAYVNWGGVMNYGNFIMLLLFEANIQFIYYEYTKEKK
jgi:hypothetical protein